MPTGGEMRRLGPIGVVRLMARGVPLLSGGREGEWQRTTTPVFPLTFVWIAALFAAIAEVVGAGYYSFRYPTIISSFLWGEMEGTFLVIVLMQTVAILWQYLITAQLLRIKGSTEEQAKSDSARITYFSAMHQVVFVPAWVGWNLDPGMQVWSESFVGFLLVMALLFAVLKLVTVTQGIRRCDVGSLGLGLIAAVFCPEFSFPVVSFVFGPYGVVMLLVLSFASPVAVSWHLRQRYPDGHCQSCGYNLTGNVSGRCPECGTEIDGEDATAHEQG